MNVKEEAKRLASEFERNSTLKLDADNRWVRQAAIIPWAELKKGCAVGAREDFRLLLAASLIQMQYLLSDEELALQISESPYLQLFCGMEGYDGARRPFTDAQMDEFRGGLSAAELRRIRGIVKADASAAR